MKRTFSFLFLLLYSLEFLAQVGINTTNPEADLDVRGLVMVQDNLFLENPGSASPSSKLLIISDGGLVNRYDPSVSPYGLINHVQYVFKDVSDYGLDMGYNTKIDASKYTLVVHEAYFVLPNNGVSVSFRSSGATRRIEGVQFYAYVSGGQWWLKGSVKNSRSYNGGTLTRTNLYMDILIYRNEFMTKIFDITETVDMAGTTTKSLVPPQGF